MSGEGWTNSLEAELTFSRIFARHDYWRENPPSVFLLASLAAGFGVWEPRTQTTQDAVGALRNLFPAGRF